MTFERRLSGALTEPEMSGKETGRPVGLRYLLQGIAIASLTATLTAGLLEVGLRLADYNRPLLYAYDLCCGASLRPGAEGWWRKEGEAYIKINSRGLRDREHSVAKPTGTFRIAVLGDSYAEALQLPMKKAFWAIMESRLQESCRPLIRKQVEVINFGVSGYGTAQELRTLETKVWAYQPDFILLAFLTGNDIRNNHRALERDPFRPYYVFRGERLVLDDSFLSEPGFALRWGWRKKIIGWIVRHSRLAQLAVEARDQLRLVLRRNGPMGATGSEPGLDNAIYAAPRTKIWREAWEVTEALIAKMADEVQERGAGFLVATLSNGIQVHPLRAKREEFKRKLGVKDLFYPDKRIAAFTKDRGIPVLTLAPKLRAWAERHGTCVHGFANAVPCGGHWNEHGHAVAGQAMADAVCRLVERERPR